MAQSAHAIAFTRQNNLVLVKLRYAWGWRLPGGGRSSGESAQEAVIRELQEEIGLQNHGSVEFAGQEEGELAEGRFCNTLLIVRDVDYRPRKWSLEVEDVIETPVEQLPQDLGANTAELLRKFLNHDFGADSRLQVSAKR